MICENLLARIGLGLLAAVLASCPVCVAPAAAAGPKVTVVAFGLFGAQGVFEREAQGAARIVAGRFGAAETATRCLCHYFGF